MARRSTSSWLWGIFATLAALALVVGGVLAFSGLRAYQDLTTARDKLLDARASVTDSPAQARADLDEAAQAAAAAADRLDGPLWSIAGAIPVLGATPRAAQASASSLDQALTALQPLADQLNILNPSSLVTDGAVDVTAIENAVPAVRQSQPGLSRAVSTLQTAPDGAGVISPVRDANDDLLEQLQQLESAVNTLATFGELAGPLLGQDGTKKYFVGVLNPNEVRGTGGFLGSFALMTATDGKIDVSEVASNGELPNLKRLPAGLDPEFEKRYSDDAVLRGNMNISPHFPTTATIWRQAWQDKTGRSVDGALAMDVVALGELVTASGQRVPLPDGGSLSGEELIDFALRGIYEKYPTAAESTARDTYQEAVSEAALDIVTRMPRPVAMAQVLGRAFTEGRAVVWSADPELEQQLVEAGVSGTLQAPEGHDVKVVAINASGSKLDAYLSRAVTYEVGRCVGEDGRVESRLIVDLRSDVPLGERPPDYMVGQAETTATGPVNTTLNQVHLPMGAKITNVEFDGQPTAVLPFAEQGRPAAVISTDLPPRQRRSLTIEFTEPAADGPADVHLQPLAKPQTSRVVDRFC